MQSYIETFLRANAAFKGFSPTQISRLSESFENRKVGPNMVLTEEGIPSSSLFLIESGECWGFRNVNSTPELVQKFSSGGSFGEEGVLHGASAAMTVKTVVDCSIWAISGDIFKLIVDTSQNQRFELLLQNPVLAKLDFAQLRNVATALVEQRHRDGEVIVAQGDSGDRFYILMQGSATANQDGKDTITYSVGAFFGERALLTNEMRAATVRSRGPSVTGSINQSQFNTLLLPRLKDALSLHVQQMGYAPAKTTPRFGGKGDGGKSDPLAFVDKLLDGDMNDRCGVGLELGASREADMVQVQRVLVGEAADLSRQIGPGDIILGIDGRRGLSLQAAVDALVGPEGSVVTLHLLRSDSVESIVPLMRGSAQFFRSVAYNDMLKKAQSDPSLSAENLMHPAPAPAPAPSNKLLPISDTLVSAKMNMNEHSSNLPFFLPVPLPKKDPPSTVLSALNEKTQAELRREALEQQQQQFEQKRAAVVPQLEESSRKMFSLTGDGKVGVGLVVENDPVTHKVYVRSIVDFAGADRSGRVFPGDKIISVNGVSVDGMPSTLFNLIRGPPGSYIDVEFAKEGAENKIVRLQRGDPDYFNSPEHFASIVTDDLLRTEISALHKKMGFFAGAHQEHKDKMATTQELVQKQHADFNTWAQPLIQRNEKASSNIKILESEFQRIHAELVYQQKLNKEKRDTIAKLMSEIEEEERLLVEYGGAPLSVANTSQTISWTEPASWKSIFTLS